MLPSSSAFLYSLRQRFQGAMLGAIVASPDHLAPFQALTDWICDRATPPLPQITQANPPLTSFHLTPLHLTPLHLTPLHLTPLWLYSHDSWRQRQGWLEQLSPQLLPQTTDLAPLWIFGEAIAQVLRPQFQPSACIPTLLDRWFSHSRSGAPDVPAVWLQDLNQLHQWLKQQQNLTTIAPQLEKIAADRRSLILALLCFLDTPRDSAIGLKRMTQMGDPIGLGLTGVLFGAHNGWESFDLNTLWAINRHIPPTQILATKLLRSWSGKLDSGQLESEKPESSFASNLAQSPIVLAPK